MIAKGNYVEAFNDAISKQQDEKDCIYQVTGIMVWLP